LAGVFHYDGRDGADEDEPGDAAFAVAGDVASGLTAAG
jgi:hypothetical protein